MRISTTDLYRLKLAFLEMERANAVVAETIAEVNVRYAIEAEDKLDINSGELTRANLNGHSTQPIPDQPATPKEAAQE